MEITLGAATLCLGSRGSRGKTPSHTFSARPCTAGTVGGSLWTSSSFSFYFSGPPLAQAIWRWPTFYYFSAASLARAGQLDIWVFDCLFISSGT